MEKPQEELPPLDIRLLMREAIVARGWSETEAARCIGQTAASLRQTLDGTRAVSAKVFHRMVKEWGIQRNRPLLQRWLLAILLDRLGLPAEGWLKRAGFTVEPLTKSAEVPPGQDFEPYRPLGPTRMQARRRLAMLRALQVAGPVGLLTAALCRVAWTLRNEAEADLRALEQSGFVTATLVGTTVTHPRMGSSQPATHKGRQRQWRITPGGTALLAELADLPDLTDADRLAC